MKRPTSSPWQFRFSFITGILAAGVVCAPPLWADEDGPRCEPPFYDMNEYQYGTRLRLAPGEDRHLPDFTLRYVGARVVSSPADPRGFTYHDFDLSRDDATRRISWGRGPGEPAPLEFEFNGQEYVMELAGPGLTDRGLDRDELVLWRRVDYLARLRERDRAPPAIK